jgi:transcription elongation factor Elf1
MKFEVIYYKKPRPNDPATESHRYTEEWGLTEFHCMKCSAQAVWQSADEDYDAGPSFICRTCGFTYSMSYASEIKDYSGLINNQDLQRLAALRKVAS